MGTPPRSSLQDIINLIKLSEMKKTGLLTILLSVVCLVANAATDIPANDSRISYSGRICWRDSLSPAFSYPGVSATLQFTGQSIAMKAKHGSGYFMVEIDNRLPFKINFTESDSILTLAEGLPEGTHRLRVVYAIEGYDKKPEFRGFILPDGGTLETPPAKPNRRIEFIGNSITCGYGIEAESEKDDFSYATENHYYSYAAQTARNLNAEYVTVARSGYGVYRNYGGPIEGNPDCIPALYDRTLFYDPDVKWDFSEFRPDVVCVNLGTNDMSLNKCDTVRFEAAYRDFLSRLRAYYPEAKIVMLTGCLLTGEKLATSCRILDRIANDARKNGDENVFRFDMSPHDGTLGIGADYHPSLRQSNKMADELTAFLRKITNWK